MYDFTFTLFYGAFLLKKTDNDQAGVIIIKAEIEQKATMRKWKRRAAPSGAGVTASQHLLHLEERVVVLLERGREKK